MSYATFINNMQAEHNVRIAYGANILFVDGDHDYDEMCDIATQVLDGIGEMRNIEDWTIIINGEPTIS